MKKEKNVKMTFEELAVKGREILARQAPTTYKEALAQVKYLKEHSKVGQWSKKRSEKD